MSAAAVLLVGLSGCGLATNAAMEQGVAACKAQGGTPTQRADCMNRVETLIVGRAPDLVNMHMAARSALAEKVERHEISEAEAQRLFCQPRCRCFLQSASVSWSSGYCKTAGFIADESGAD
jgi:hypothetical protein